MRLSTKITTVTIEADTTSTGQYPKNWGQQNRHDRDFQRQNNLQPKRYQYPDQDQKNDPRGQHQDTKQVREVERVRYRDVLVITLEANMVDVEADEIEGVERTSTVVQTGHLLY